jgi:hypothetical protein
MNHADHPTVRRLQETQGNRAADAPQRLDASWLRELCLESGADDAGLVEIGRPALDDQRADILGAFPAAKTLVSFVCRMNREPIRSPARSVANLEFHPTGDHVNEVARKVVATLGFVAKERGLVWALLRRKIRIKGSPRLLVAFGKCFPS